jgi:hypothetical protein
MDSQPTTGASKRLALTEGVYSGYRPQVFSV